MQPWSYMNSGSTNYFTPSPNSSFNAGSGRGKDSGPIRDRYTRPSSFGSVPPNLSTSSARFSPYTANRENRDHLYPRRNSIPLVLARRESQLQPFMGGNTRNGSHFENASSTAQRILKILESVSTPALNAKRVRIDSIKSTQIMGLTGSSSTLNMPGTLLPSINIFNRSPKTKSPSQRTLSALWGQKCQKSNPPKMVAVGTNTDKELSTETIRPHSQRRNSEQLFEKSDRPLKLSVLLAKRKPENAAYTFDNPLSLKDVDNYLGSYQCKQYFDRSDNYSSNSGDLKRWWSCPKCLLLYEAWAVSCVCCSERNPNITQDNNKQLLVLPPSPTQHQLNAPLLSLEAASPTTTTIALEPPQTLVPATLTDTNENLIESHVSTEVSTQNSSFGVTPIDEDGYSSNQNQNIELWQCKICPTQNPLWLFTCRLCGSLRPREFDHGYKSPENKLRTDTFHPVIGKYPRLSLPLMSTTSDTGNESTGCSENSAAFLTSQLQNLNLPIAEQSPQQETHPEEFLEAFRSARMLTKTKSSMDSTVGIGPNTPGAYLINDSNDTMTIGLPIQNTNAINQNNQPSGFTPYITPNNFPYNLIPNCNFGAIGPTSTGIYQFGAPLNTMPSNNFPFGTTNSPTTSYTAPVMQFSSPPSNNAGSFADRRRLKAKRRLPH